MRRRRSATGPRRRCDRCDRPVSATGGGSSSTARRARSARRPCSSPSTSAPTSRPSAAPSTWSSSGRSAPTRSSTTAGGLHEERPDVRRDHRRRRQVLVPPGPTRAEAGRDLRRHRRRTLPARDAGLLCDPLRRQQAGPTAIGRRSKDDVLFLKELIEAGEFRAVVDRRYPMDQVAEAHRYVEGGTRRGPSS